MQRTNPADLLFGAYRRSVLEFLLSRPDEAFHVREIARRTGVPAGSLHRELRQLEQAGLLRSTAQGNQVRYSANASSPVYAELAGLLRKTAAQPLAVHSAPPAHYVVNGAELEVPKQRLAGICWRHGVKKLSIYGPAARGEMLNGSGVDVLVELGPRSSAAAFDLLRMQDELSALFGDRRVAIETQHRGAFPDLKVLYEDGQA